MLTRKISGLTSFLATVIIVSVAVATAASAVFFSKTALAEQPQETPLLAIVVGFDGANAGTNVDTGSSVGMGSGIKSLGAVPYSNVYDWNEVLLSGEDSLFAYFQGQSNGAFSLVPARETSAFDGKRNTNRADKADDGVVHVTLASDYHAWGLVNEDLSVTEDFGRIVLNAIAKAQAYVDFDSYDANGDGEISPEELFVVVCVPGYDASAFSQPGRTDLPLMWPHSGKITQKLISEAGLSGAVPTSYFAVTENFVREGDELSDAIQEPIGILAHELGHCLGLPDLYALNAGGEDAAWKAFEVGKLSLMANGAWTEGLDDQRGWVFMPSALDPWCLTKLGWCQPQTVEASGEYHLFSRESEAGYNALLIPTGDPDQYFLVENREPEGCDAGLVSTYGDDDSCGGIVVWHVDQGICERFDKGNAVNNTDHRPGVMPVFFEKAASGTATGTAGTSGAAGAAGASGATGAATGTSDAAGAAGAYSFDWAYSTPDLDEPFFSAASIKQNLGDASTIIELPLYAKDGDDEPARRVSSGISLQVLSDPGQDMVVRIELPGGTGSANGVGGTGGGTGNADGVGSGDSSQRGADPQAGVGDGEAGSQGAADSEADPQGGAGGEADAKSPLTDAAPAIAICAIAVLCAVAAFAARKAKKHPIL